MQDTRRTVGRKIRGVKIIRANQRSSAVRCHFGVATHLGVEQEAGRCDVRLCEDRPAVDVKCPLLVSEKHVHRRNSYDNIRFTPRGSTAPALLGWRSMDKATSIAGVLHFYLLIAFLLRPKFIPTLVYDPRVWNSLCRAPCCTCLNYVAPHLPIA